MNTRVMMTSQTCSRQPVYTIKANTTQMTRAEALVLLQSLNEEQFASFWKFDSGACRKTIVKILSP